MLVIAAALLLALTASFTGGRLSRLASMRLRSAWLPLVALAIQVLIIEVLDRGPRPVRRGGRPLLLVDIAVPRDIDPRVGNIGFQGATIEFPMTVTNKNTYALPIAGVTVIEAVATGEPGKAPAWNFRTTLAAVIVPSRLAPSLTSITPPEVGPVARNTSSRDITIFTGRCALRDSATASGSR